MVAKKSNTRVKMRTMVQEVTLPELLDQYRNGRSFSEMGRLCKLSAMTIQRIHTGSVELPSRSTLEALSRGYGIHIDRLALAAYGRLFEEVPEAPDDTETLEDATAAADIARNGHWKHQPTSPRATASR